jgi:hypothetical protein
MKKNTLKDPLTGEEFIPKKVSQRFAKPQNRIKYNNEKANKIRLKRAFIDKPLHQNHTILLELLNGKNEITIHQEFLRGKGYDFYLTTHFDKWEEKNVPCIYEFLIIALPNQQIKILKNDRY